MIACPVEGHDETIAVTLSNPVDAARGDAATKDRFQDHDNPATVCRDPQARSGHMVHGGFFHDRT